MNYSIFKLCVFYTAPSGTPASVAAKAVSSTTVEVSWKVKFCLSFNYYIIYTFFLSPDDNVC